MQLGAYSRGRRSRSRAPFSFVAFRRSLESEARREFARFGPDAIPLSLLAEVPAGVVGRLGRYDVADLEPLGKAALATDCGRLLGRVEADKAGMVMPVIAGDEYRLLLLAADRGRIQARLAPVGHAPTMLGAWGEPSSQCEGLFVDALRAGLERRRCPDCGTRVGATHRAGCDVARCAQCRRQHMLCDCDAPAEPWAGESPGVYECRALDFYARQVDRGWERCLRQTPGAREDLNRLAEYWAAQTVM